METKQAERLAAARLLIGIHGTELSDEARQMVERTRVGGVILFARNVATREQVAELNGEIIGRTADTEPAFICVDQEGGPVARLRERVTVFPAAAQFGAIDDAELTARCATVAATELRALGFNVNFAPVVDVNTNPDNPVIGVRAFGDDPQLVSKHACAYIEAAQAAGMIACAKHFPGHGDTRTDSHYDLPTLDHDEDRMASVELVPFCQAAAANVAMVMTAHVMFPHYDDVNPATMSSVLLGKVLREQVGFQGVVVSDDLEMHAITKGWGVPEAAAASIAAGADLLLVCHTHDLQMASIEAIAKGLVDRDIDERQFMLGHQRIMNLKQRYLSRELYVEPDMAELKRVVDTAENADLLAEVNRRAQDAEAIAMETSGGGAKDSGAT